MTVFSMVLKSSLKKFKGQCVICTCYKFLGTASRLINDHDQFKQNFKK